MRVINTVYVVLSKVGKSKMSWVDSSLLLLFRPLHSTCGCFRLTMPENGLATAECDFTEREAVWTGFLYGLI